MLRLPSSMGKPRRNPENVIILGTPAFGDPEGFVRIAPEEVQWRDLPGYEGVKFAIICQVFPGDALRRSEAEIVQRDLKAVGIDIQLREIEPNADRGCRGHRRAM